MLLLLLLLLLHGSDDANRDGYCTVIPGRGPWVRGLAARLPCLHPGCSRGAGGGVRTFSIPFVTRLSLLPLAQRPGEGLGGKEGGHTLHGRALRACVTIASP